jgi:3-dehydro-L-gulonate 2-dehydrogenase
VYSHGLNRFGGFVSAVVDGRFDKSARPTTELRFGCVEQWDGHGGIGLWNATAAMTRAVELVRAVDCAAWQICAPCPQ